MPCGSRDQRGSEIFSGWPSVRCANAHVLAFETFVRMADSRCELPVLYCMPVPGSSISGRPSAYDTQLRLDTHRP